MLCRFAKFVHTGTLSFLPIKDFTLKISPQTALVIAAQKQLLVDPTNSEALSVLDENFNLKIGKRYLFRTARMYTFGVYVGCNELAYFVMDAEQVVETGETKLSWLSKWKTAEPFEPEQVIHVYINGIVDIIPAK